MALMKETFGATSRVRGVGVLEEIRAEATVSGDVKESICNGEQNMILPNTQSINGWKWVSQLCPSLWHSLSPMELHQMLQSARSLKGNGPEGL